MRSITTLAVAALASNSAMAFAPPSAPLRPMTKSARAASGLKMVYIPDGLSQAEWKKIQAEEKKKQENLGKLGPQRFKSRSFQAWQESGAGHLFPVDPKKVKSGEIPMDKVPYMQRGGAWDDSDLTRKAKAKMAARKEVVVNNNKTSKKIVPKKWTSTDTAYANGGYVKEQSVSIFGGTPLPWVINGSGKSPGVETDNKRKLGVQKKVTRAVTNKPISPAVQRRIEREAAEERKRQEKLKAQLNGEKKGPFGLW